MDKQYPKIDWEAMRKIVERQFSDTNMNKLDVSIDEIGDSVASPGGKVDG